MSTLYHNNRTLDMKSLFKTFGYLESIFMQKKLKIIKNCILYRNLYLLRERINPFIISWILCVINCNDLFTCINYPNKIQKSIFYSKNTNHSKTSRGIFEFLLSIKIWMRFANKTIFIKQLFSTNCEFISRYSEEYYQWFIFLQLKFVRVTTLVLRPLLSYVSIWIILSNMSDLMKY